MKQLELPFAETRMRGADPYMRVCPTGRKFHFLTATPVDYRIDEIVHHLSRLPRYLGGSTYTVGQHSVVAARMANRFYPQALLPARMVIHDFAESKLGDLPTPLKAILPDYRALETTHDRLVERRFDLTFIGDPLVKEVDTRMWLTERLVVSPYLCREDDYTGPLVEFPLDDEEMAECFEPWSTEVVEHELRLALLVYLPWVMRDS